MTREQSHKDIATSEEKLLAIGEKGQIVDYEDEVFIAKHEIHRFRGNGLPRRHIYTSDTVALPYNYKYVNYEQTLELVSRHLACIKNGTRPSCNTTGIEIEGTFVNEDGELETDVFNKANGHSNSLHPELMESTGEFVTKGLNGSNLIGPIEVANGLGKAIAEGVTTAEKMGCRFVIASNPEVSGDQGNTDIPYLNRFAPIVKEDARLHADAIPEETRDIYERAGRPVESNLSRESNTLDWPNQSTHIHFGVPQHEDGKIDPRVALVAAHIRLSPFAKVLRSTLYSTRHLYGTEFDVKDSRAFSRRLLHTAHDTQLPNNYPEYVRKSIGSVVEGTSPDISRFSGGHDRTRITPKKTNEDIGAPATPDTRAVLAFALAQEVMNTIALEALQYAEGNERKAISYLDNSYDGLLTAQPGMGEGSDHEWDVIFNKYGYEGPVIRRDLTDTAILIERVGNEYEILRTSSRIINHILLRSSTEPDEQDLYRRLGINEKGEYDPSLPVNGLVSEHKVGMDPNVLATIQHNATKAQSLALQEITTEEDLLQFFGICTA